MMLAGLFAFAVAPTLLPAQAVDLRVKTAIWFPSGRAIIYAREEATGIGLGIYDLGRPEGKVVIRLATKDAWRCDWFSGSEEALVTVEGEEGEGEVKAYHSLLYLVDAKKESAAQVFSRTSAGKAELHVWANLSPSLTHGIFDVHEGQRISHWILPLGGRFLIPSPDIDVAAANGLAGPRWSRDGTALYDPSEVSLPPSTILPGTRLRLSYVFVDDAKKGDGDEMTIRPAGAAPAAGKPVLEVVPQNGVIRPVRSPGPWVAPPYSVPKATVKPQTLDLRFDDLRLQSQGLFLAGVGKTPWQTLIAPKAEWGRLAPDGGAVAYGTDDVLFVRRVKFARD